MSMSGSTNFSYQNTADERQLFCDDVPLAQLAQEYGTPLFVYSAKAIKEQYHHYLAGIADFNKNSRKQARLFYALKANPTMAILRIFHQLGAGFDTVSSGEMHRALLAGANGKDIVFSGVGKSVEELKFAMQQEVASICIESWAEFDRIRTLANNTNQTANLSVRVNPAIEADTHPNIHTGGKEHKFGVEQQEAQRIIIEAQKDDKLNLIGISCHIGSQILSLEPFLLAAHKMREFYDSLKADGIELHQVSLGGGFGISYRHDEEQALNPDNYKELVEVFADTPVNIVLEPGRSLIAAAGCLLTKVEYIKDSESKDGKNFVITDAAMNDLLRPALYDAYHEIYPVNESSPADSKAYDLVGPVCESGDVLARERQLAVKPGDLLVLSDVGAYAMTMSSNYNSRCRAAEVMVHDNGVNLIRRREQLEDLWRLEILDEEGASDGANE